MINMKKVKIGSSCEPYMYNTCYELRKIEIGNVVTLKFGEKPFRVKKEYVGKELKFMVNNVYDYEYGCNHRRLALVPLDKVESFKKKDVLFLDSSGRFESLMIDLYPCNRRPYAGWRNKTVEIISLK